MSAVIVRNRPVFEVPKSPLTNWNSTVLMVLLFGVSLALLNACALGKNTDIDTR